MDLKQKILDLREKGKTYSEIRKQLNCSLSTISFHCTSKKKRYESKNQARKTYVSDLKKQYGGKCKICGYKRCFDALVFHHKNPKNKKDKVSKIVYRKGIKAAKEEAKKCVLICANCHAEVHAGLTKI